MWGWLTNEVFNHFKVKLLYPNPDQVLLCRNTTRLLITALSQQKTWFAELYSANTYSGDWVGGLTTPTSFPYELTNFQHIKANDIPSTSSTQASVLLSPEPMWVSYGRLAPGQPSNMNFKYWSALVKVLYCRHLKNNNPAHINCCIKQ